MFIHIDHLAPPMVVSLVEITLKQEKADLRSTLAGKLNVGCSPLDKKAKSFSQVKVVVTLCRFHQFEKELENSTSWKFQGGEVITFHLLEKVFKVEKEQGVGVFSQYMLQPGNYQLSIYL